MSLSKNNPKVLVCVNRRFGIDTPSCAMRGSEKILEKLKSELIMRETPFKIEKFMCLGQCQKGPAIRIAPGGEFYLGAKLDNIDDIADWVQSEALNMKTSE